MSFHPLDAGKKTHTQRSSLKKERPGSQEDRGPEATDLPTFLLKALGRLQFAGEVTAWMEDSTVGGGGVILNMLTPGRAQQSGVWP